MSDETDLQDLIGNWARQLMAEQAQMVEDDLVLVMGWHARLPESVIKRLGYEVIWQKAPNGAAVEDYRGIRRHGKWLVDRFPSWPFDDTP